MILADDIFDGVKMGYGLVKKYGPAVKDFVTQAMGIYHEHKSGKSYNPLYKGDPETPEEGGMETVNCRAFWTVFYPSA